METAPPGPRRMRINPFSSSSSTFSSRAEGLAEAAAGAFSGSGGRLGAPVAVDSLKRSCKPRGGSVPTSRPVTEPVLWPGRREGGSLDAPTGLLSGTQSP